MTNPNLQPQQFSGRKNTAYWKGQISSMGEGVHDVPGTVHARRAIKQTMDEQGYEPDHPLRGVLQETPGGRNLVHVSQGKINAGIHYSVNKDFDEKPIDIEQVRVAEGAQRQGIGSKMIKELVSSHPESSEMRVFGAIESAKPWYAKHGAEFQEDSSMGKWNTDTLNHLRGV